MFGGWFPGQEETTILENQDERLCGKTAHILPEQRRAATFSVEELTSLLDGGEKQTARRRWIWKQGEMFNNANNYNLTREELISQHIQRFLGVHQQYTDDGFVPSQNDGMLMSIATKNGGAMSLHYGAFLPTIASQGTNEQRMHWLFPAFQMKIIGCLAQTELGHGSNVRGLQTTATFDKATQEFILHSPTLQSLKWWPGGLGKTATHSVVYAQLIIDGKCYGVHSFIIQLRDDSHRPLPGIELGEVGPKIGDNFTETGFMRLTQVRIPRDWMLMKNQEVTPEGEYIKHSKGKSGDKIQYTTMLSIRTALVITAGYKLAQGVTIAARYSCIRHQGFVDPDKTQNTDFTAPERAIIDYQVQAFRIFKQLACAYAFIFTGKFISEKFQTLREQINSDPEHADLSSLPEMHASSAGLKALCTFTTADGLEECRKCCGGHGVLLASGVAQMAVDYVTYCTAEGDRIILELQCARFLIKSFHQSKANEPLSGVCNYLEPIGHPTFSLSNMLASQINSPKQFYDLQELVRVFEHRALVQVAKTATKMAEAKDSSDTEVRNRFALELVNASRHHCYLVILKSFVSQVKSVSNEGVHAVLENLCVFFALSHIQENSGDWISYFSQQQIEWVRKCVRDLLVELRPNLIGLTDAFEFPDNVLNSALGRHDGRVYESLYQSAKNSPLNKEDPFTAYQYLESVLDKEFLKVPSLSKL